MSLLLIVFVTQEYSQSEKFRADVYRAMGYVCATLPCGLVFNLCVTAARGYSFRDWFVLSLSTLFFWPAYRCVNIAYNILLQEDKSKDDT